MVSHPLRKSVTVSQPEVFLSVSPLFSCRGVKPEALAPASPRLSPPAGRVINAGKSMLNEDQASCEKLFVKKSSGKHRNSTLLEDNRVSGWKLTMTAA